MTADKRKCFNKIFQHLLRQLLQEAGTKAISPRSIFGKKRVQMQKAAEEEFYGVAEINTDKGVGLEIRPSTAETEATTRSIPDMDWVATELERRIYSITLNEQMQFKKKLFICMADFETCRKVIGIQELRKIIKQHVIHFRYAKMHHVSYISESIQRMDSGNNFTTNFPEWLHIGNVKEVYRPTTRVKYIGQKLKHNDQCTSLDYMEKTLFHLVI